MEDSVCGVSPTKARKRIRQQDKWKNNVAKRLKEPRSMQLKFHVMRCDGVYVPVCKQAFLKILQITRARVDYVAKHFVAKCTVPTEKRGGNRKSLYQLPFSAINLRYYAAGKRQTIRLRHLAATGLTASCAAGRVHQHPPAARCSACIRRDGTRSALLSAC
ncbi:hypothetical protein J6590_051531 [Homalodisca vitripennis]|nr:hypothetical protein J6590_051531 [Homalodisca vitripennis]